MATPEIALARYVLVRHAEPYADEQRPASQWRLSQKGRVDSAKLAQRLVPHPLTRLVTSTEARAVETAEIIARVLGVELRTDARLVEVRRPWVEDDFESVVTQYLSGHPVRDWEPVDEVRTRVGGAIAGVGHRELVGLVSHGTAMTAWLASQVALDSKSFWGDLRCPDAWLVAGPEFTRL